MEDSEKQSLLGGRNSQQQGYSGRGGDAGTTTFEQVSDTVRDAAAATAAEPQVSVGSYIGPDELPPPYQQDSNSGGPVVTCRVCQAMIDISWKREQHVVKCLQCNEATVRFFDL